MAYNFKQYGLPLVGQRRCALHTLRELLEFSAEGYKDKVAYIFAKDGKDGYITYGEFGNECEVISSALSGEIGQGEKIAIMMNPSHKWLEVFFAITGLGAIAVLIPDGKETDWYNQTLKEIGCTKLVAEKATEHIYGNLSAEKSVEKFFVYEDVIKRSFKEYEKPALSSNTVSAILFTSGTTGDSKAALLTHRNIVVSAFHPATRLAYDKDGVYVSILPLYHIFGLTTGLLTFFYGGVKTVVNQSKATLFPNILKYKPSCLVSVPSVTQLLGQIAQNSGFDKVFPNLEVIILGGASAEKKVFKSFHDAGVTVQQGYGLTECGVVTTTLGDPRMSATIGKVCEFITVKLVEREIYVKGDGVFKGYLDPTRDAEMLVDGWLKTGDLGEFDEQGNLYITGRKCFIIVTDDGENISPEELESKLYSINEIKECLVSEERNEQGNVFICAEIFTEKEDFEICKIKITEINNSIPAYMNIKKVIYRDVEFAKNSIGKLIRKQVVIDVR